MRALGSALVAALVLTFVAAASGAQRPALSILDLTPLTVRGTSFRAGERVTLLVSAGKPITSRVRAGERGGFLVRFPVHVKGCMSVDVQAIGAHGSRAATGLAMAGCDERP